ncbi:MAG: ATP-binding cassette domain-containing protein [Christensenellales bacterium]
MSALLDLQHVSIQFHTDAGTVQAVRDVSFSLNEKETLAIVGESGCGKSVLCKSILHLLPHSGHISSGKVLFNGRDLAPLSEKAMDQIRGRISMIFQDPMTSLNPTLSVGRQIPRRLFYMKISPKPRPKNARFTGWKPSA